MHRLQITAMTKHQLVARRALSVATRQVSLACLIFRAARPEQALPTHSQGMPATQTDALMHQTTITYDATGIYPQQIQSPSTNGISHKTGCQYDPITGSLLSRTDENGQKTQYSYDEMGRVWTVKAKSGCGSNIFLRSLLLSRCPDSSEVNG